MTSLSLTDCVHESEREGRDMLIDIHWRSLQSLGSGNFLQKLFSSRCDVESEQVTVGPPFKKQRKKRDLTLLIKRAKILN